MAILQPSTLIRTSFVLSGLLGLKFDGIPDGNGRSTTIEGMIPIQISCLNETTPLEVFKSFTKQQSNKLRKIAPSAQRQAPPPTEYLPQKNPKQQFGKERISSANKILTTEASTAKSIQKEYEQPTPTPTALTTNKPISQLASSPAEEKPKVSEEETVSTSTCEEQMCNRNETCVTWIREDSKDMSFYECVEDPKDGFEFSPINPTKGKLCPVGQTHSATLDPKECKGSNCSIVWKFKCVDESDSPHSCKLKKCPLAACIEQINCGIQRPCTIEAVCIPSYLIPPYV